MIAIKKSQTALYIDGGYQQTTSNDSFDVINPATSKIINIYNLPSCDDTKLAIASAKKAQKSWSKLSAGARGKILIKAAELLMESNDELAKLETVNTGKPLQESIAVDIASAADCLHYFGSIAAGMHGEHFDFGDSFAYTRREPLGVCAGIGAWNYPIQIAAWKAAPALACGNTMVYKPSEFTPLTSLRLAEIFTEAGLPDGVFNVVAGGRAVGEVLTTHKDIAKVSLTGSVATGKKIMATAANTLKHVTLELGGKSPLIIFADADINNAVSAAMMANFYTQGEICSNGTRVFVAKEILTEFTQQLIERTKNMIIGDPLDMKTQIGSLISKEHKKSVLEYIAIGKKEGAKILCGGNSYEKDNCAQGAFVEPTIFLAQDDMRIATEEIFGPVMCILPFTDEADVITRANSSEFGLAAGVFTQNIQRGHRVVAQLEAGTCWINNYNITPIEMPFGGVKNSGIGRENSLAAIEHYTQRKSVYVELGDVDCDY